MISLDRNYWQAVNLLCLNIYVLPILFHLNILKTVKILQFLTNKKKIHDLRLATPPVTNVKNYSSTWVGVVRVVGRETNDWMDTHTHTHTG